MGKCILKELPHGITATWRTKSGQIVVTEHRLIHERRLIQKQCVCDSYVMESSCIGLIELRSSKPCHPLQHRKTNTQMHLTLYFSC